MKTPFELIKDTYHEVFSKGEENLKFIFDLNEKIIVWIVGFSFTAIGLIIAQWKNLHPNSTSNDIKCLITFFILAIISGLIYRVSASYFRKFQNKCFSTFLILSQKMEAMSIRNHRASDINDIDELIFLLERDFGFDSEKFSEVFEKSENEQRRKEISDYLKSVYDRNAEWSKENYEEGMLWLRNTIQTSLKLNEKDVDLLLYGKPFKSFIFKDEVVYRKAQGKFVEYCFNLSFVFFGIGLLVVFFHL